MKLLKIPILFLVTLFLLVGHLANAQDSKMIKANKLFEQGAYPEATQLFKDVIERTNNPYAKIRLADCYRLMKQPIISEYWYEQVIGIPESKPIHQFYYGMALKANGKYEDAQKVFQEYAQLVPSDSRGLMQVEACKRAYEFQTDPGKYKVQETTVNSELADFGAAFYKNGVIFASEANVDARGKYYVRRNAPFLDLFFAKADKTPAKLGRPIRFKGQANSPLHEGAVSFDKDFKTMYFTGNNAKKYNSKTGGTVNLQIFTATLADNQWGNIQAFQYNSDDYSVGHPALSPDGNTLYFVSDMPGGKGGTDLYKCSKQGSGWGKPENLGGIINTEGDEMFPFMSNDGTLYFSSEGLPGLGGLDVFSTKARGNGWAEPKNLFFPINTNGDDFAFIIDPSNTYGYFSSNRAGGKGDDDIYSFNVMEQKPVVVTPPPPPPPTVKTPPPPPPPPPVKTPAPVVVQPPPPPVVKAPAPPPPPPPVVEAPKPIYCTVMGYVYEKESKRPVSGATMSLIDKRTSRGQTLTSANNGYYSFEIEPGKSYSLTISKQFYLTEVISVSTVGRDCSVTGQGAIERDFNISKIPDVDPNTGTLKKPITIISGGESSHPNLPLPELRHIYYDYDSHVIRPDAQVELDKVVSFMLSNPNLIIELNSHTDSRGSDSYNQELSQKRAQAAIDYMVARGVSRQNISGSGYGESRLVNRCANGVKCSDAEHEQNRRTEFVITGFLMR